MANTMPIGQMVTPTSKWQVTIPKKVREGLSLEKDKPLNVTMEKGKIVMVPVKRVVREEIWNEERRKKLIKALDEIQGIWANDKTWPKTRARRKKIEIAASKKMKKPW